MNRRTRFLTALAVVLLLAIVEVNAYAFVYAYGMTHVQGGERTAAEHAAACG